MIEAQTVIAPTIETQICERAQEFDLLALLRLLKARGYDVCKVRFQSRDSLASQDQLIHAVDFQRNGFIFITLNMGLLSAQSPVPSYIFRKRDVDKINQEAFNHFVRYFDHMLIKNLLLNIYPELNAFFFTDWEKEKADWIALQNPAAHATLHWLFQRAFPELQVCTEKLNCCHRTATPQLHIGNMIIGESGGLGGEQDFPTPMMRVTLTGESEFFEAYHDWPRHFQQRLCRLVYPFLYDRGLFLEIILNIPTSARRLRLNGRSKINFEQLAGHFYEIDAHALRELKQYAAPIHLLRSIVGLQGRRYGSAKAFVKGLAEVLPRRELRYHLRALLRHSARREVRQFRRIQFFRGELRSSESLLQTSFANLNRREQRCGISL